MSAESISDSELVGAYASQGLIIGVPGTPGAITIDSPLMQQHVRGLRAAVEFGLGKLAAVKPIAVVHPAILNYHASIARLEEAGYVVIATSDPHAHVATHNAPAPAIEDVKGWQEGDVVRGSDVKIPPSLPLGLRWEPFELDAWKVVKDLAPIGG